MMLIKIKNISTGKYSDGGERAYNLRWVSSGKIYNKIGYVKAHLNNLINSGSSHDPFTDRHLLLIQDYIKEVSFEFYFLDGYTKTKKDIESITELYVHLEQIKLQIVLMKI